MAMLINICGNSHSGTTMLDLMLGNTPNAFSCGEVRALYRPWRKHHFEIDCVCSENPCPYWEKLKLFPENKFHVSVSQLFNVKYVIDSSKNLSWVIDNNRWAIENDMEVINVVIWKELTSLAYSFWKRNYAADAWRDHFIGYFEKLLQIKLPFFTVSYRELIANPQAKLAKICEAVGMEYFPGKENFWTKSHHHLFGSASVRVQVQKKDSIIKKQTQINQRWTEEIETVNQQIAKDIKVQRIFRTLKEFEISNISRLKVLPVNTYLSPTQRPLWYYRDHIIKRYRRWFPKKW